MRNLAHVFRVTLRIVNFSPAIGVELGLILFARVHTYTLENSKEKTKNINDNEKKSCTKQTSAIHDGE